MWDLCSGLFILTAIIIFILGLPLLLDPGAVDRILASRRGGRFHPDERPGWKNINRRKGR